MLRLSKNKLIGIIVLGGHVQGLGIVRIFGKQGIPSIVIDKTAYCLARHSVYSSAFFKVDDNDLMDFLERPSTIKEYRNWIIFPTNDYHVKILSQNKLNLGKSFIVSTDKWDVIKIFYNKIDGYKLAAKEGIPMPDTFYPENISDLDKCKIEYPCIIKPAVMIDFYKQVKKKVFVCRNTGELRENYMKALKLIPPDEIIIQEIIPGSSKNLFSACFLFLKGKSYVYLTACRMRQHPLDFGNATTYAETIDLPIIKNYAEKILRAAEFNGICEVEFKRDERDGYYKFLEVNPRTWKWHAISNEANTPFLILFYNWLRGKEIIPEDGFKEASFVHLLTDIPTRAKLLLRGEKYWCRVRRPVENAVWSASDPKPWLFEKIYLIYFIFYR